jgi:hypothetical protein
VNQGVHCLEGNGMQVILKKVRQGFGATMRGLRSSNLREVLSVGPGHDLL